jgi:hypothetical protein
MSDDSSSFRSRFSNSALSSSFTDRKRSAMLISTDQSGSSEETGFETDTMDELSPASIVDAMSLSSLSASENSNEIVRQVRIIVSLFITIEISYSSRMPLKNP